MDILYISPKTSKELTQYCEEKLLTEVMEHFASIGTVVAKKDNEAPSRWWIVTDYIKNKTIDRRKKLSVILSMAAIGSIIQIGDRQEVGNVNVLCMLKDLDYISEEDFEYFVDVFFLFSKGKGVKFS